MRCGTGLKKQIMTNIPLYDEIYKHVREIDGLLKKYKGKSRVKPKPHYECNGKTDMLLLERCATVFEASKESIISNSRKQNLVLARQLYCYIRYHHNNMLPQQIAEELGRDRTTVLHSIKQIGDLLQVDKILKKKYNQIINT
jgi:chromosomal replication initiation ATPase DnaA